MTLLMKTFAHETWLMQRLNRRPPPGKSRVVINPIQTRTADRLQAQRSRMLRLVALTSSVRGLGQCGRSLQCVRAPNQRGPCPARVASLAGLFFVGRWGHCCAEPGAASIAILKRLVAHDLAIGGAHHGSSGEPDMLDRSLEAEFASYRKTLSTDEARRAFDERIERLLSQHGVDYVRGYVDALKDASS
jgi:hypothetical protein